MNTLVKSDWIGRVIAGRFPLLEWLGSSGDGHVFRTEWQGPGAQPAAIKLLPFEAESGALRLTAWQTAASLSQPHLLHIFDYGRAHAEGAELLYVVTEFAPEALSQVIPDRPLTAVEAGEMLTPVIDALSYLHGKGLVHGQLRPSNILAVGDQLKLSSDHLHRRDTHRQEGGTASIYEAPEIVNGAWTPAADVWSLGVTLVEALTQQPPIWDRNATADPVVPGGMPQPFKDIAARCLRTDPIRRATLDELATLLNPQAAAPRVAKAIEPLTPPAAPPPARPVASATAAPPAPAAAAPPPSRPAAMPPMSPNRLAESAVRAPLPPTRRVGWMVAAAVAVMVILAVILLRSHKNPPNAAQSNAAAQNQSPATTSTAPATQSAPPAATQDSPAAAAAAPNASANVRGAVDHQVLPDLEPRAVKTIHGRFKVSVRVTVEPSGAVSNAQLESRGPSRYFASRALQAAGKWTFKAPQVNGQPSSSQWLLRFEFSRNGTDVSSSEINP